MNLPDNFSVFDERNRREAIVLKAENALLKWRLLPVAEPVPDEFVPTTSVGVVRTVFNGRPLSRAAVNDAVQSKFPGRMYQGEVFRALDNLVGMGEIKAVNKARGPGRAYINLCLILLGGFMFVGCRFLPGGSYLEEPAWEQKPRQQLLTPRMPAMTDTLMQRIEKKEARKRHTVETFHIPQFLPEIFRAPGLRAEPVASSPTNAFVTLQWDYSPSSNIIAHCIEYGPSTNDFTNVWVTGYTNQITVNNLDPVVPQYFFRVRGRNDVGVMSEPSNTVKNPPDVIQRGWLQTGPLSGPFTNWIPLFDFTNSPPNQEQGFRVSAQTEYNYAP